MLFTSSALWPVDPTTLKWSTLGLMVLCLVATFAHVRRAPSGSSRKGHLVLSPLAFFAWA